MVDWVDQSNEGLHLQKCLMKIHWILTLNFVDSDWSNSLSSLVLNGDWNVLVIDKWKMSLHQRWADARVRTGLRIRVRVHAKNPYLCRVESKLNSFLIERLWNDWSVKLRSLSVPISSDLSNVLSPQISFGDIVVSIGDTDVPGDVTQDWIESGDCTSEYADSGDKESSLIPVKSWKIK